MRIRIFISVIFVHICGWSQQIHFNRGFKTNSCYQIRSLLKCEDACQRCSLTLYPETTARLEMNVNNFEKICTGKDLKRVGIAFFKTLHSPDQIALIDISQVNKNALEVYKQVEQIYPKSTDCPK